MGRQQIKLNRAKCQKCGDTLESLGVEDRKVCKCKNLVVGGGLVELYRQALYISQVVEMSEFDYDPDWQEPPGV